MEYDINDKIEWLTIFIYEFGKRHGLNMKQANNYLHRYHGSDFAEKHYDYFHTQSFASVVDDITEYCHIKGGALV